MFPSLFFQPEAETDQQINNGGVISGGTATNGGGNTRAYGSTSGTCTVNISHCAILDGSVIGDSTIASSSRTYQGGNARFTYSNTQISNCYILGGSCTSAGGYGGNLSVGSGLVNLFDSIIANGSSPKGGNLYSAAVTTELSTAKTNGSPTTAQT